MGKFSFKLHCRTSFLKKSLSFGFTLTEVLVTIAIVGLLSVLAISSLKPKFQIQKAHDGQRRADLKRISTALEDYLSDHPCYPLESEMECNPGLGLRPYLNKIPCDPVTKVSYPYSRPDNCSFFIVYANLETEFNQTYGSYNYAVTSPNLRIFPTILVSTVAPSQGVEPTSVVTPTSLPVPTSGVNNYGCFSGVCQSLPGEICQPNYLSYDCYNQCGTVDNPKNECK